MEKPMLSSAFRTYYKDNIVPLILLTSPEDVYKFMQECENSGKVDEADERLEKLKAFKDTNAVWFIGVMAGEINYATMHGVGLSLINAISAVTGCLTSESYWTNVWNNDFTTSEASNLRKLGEALTIAPQYI